MNQTQQDRKRDGVKMEMRHTDKSDQTERQTR